MMLTPLECYKMELIVFWLSLCVSYNTSASQITSHSVTTDKVYKINNDIKLKMLC